MNYDDCRAQQLRRLRSTIGFEAQLSSTGCVSCSFCIVWLRIFHLDILPSRDVEIHKCHYRQRPFASRTQVSFASLCYWRTSDVWMSLLDWATYSFFPVDTSVANLARHAVDRICDHVARSFCSCVLRVCCTVPSPWRQCEHSEFLHSWLLLSSS
jgi:hypothetical protein